MDGSAPRKALKAIVRVVGGYERRVRLVRLLADSVAIAAAMLMAALSLAHLVGALLTMALPLGVLAVTSGLALAYARILDGQLTTDTLALTLDLFSRSQGATRDDHEVDEAPREWPNQDW